MQKQGKPLAWYRWVFWSSVPAEEHEAQALKKKNPEMQSSILRVKENKCQDCDWNRKLTSKGSIQKNVCLVLSFLTPQTLVSPQETESHMTPANSLTGNDIVERKFYDHNLLVSTWSETFL